jgi:formylglycine-generating enzyme
MTRTGARVAAGVFALGLLSVGVIFVVARRGAGDAPCGGGFARAGARCLVPPGAPCPDPLVTTPEGCGAPEELHAKVPETRVVVGPSDWEAEGRVAPRTVHVHPFRLDRLEVTASRAHCPRCPLADRERYDAGDPARAASEITRAEARAFCASRGGRLPTEDEWIAAAAGEGPRRYPWGDTGAVCRRAAWGLLRGPCGKGATGPDTVGAHPEGATPLGIHDLAGNVAEWVESADGRGIVRGGAWDTDLATELRTWVRREVDPEARDPTIGFRCAYTVR